MTTCPYCKDSVVESHAVYCPSCEAAHHKECWEANHRKCSVFGCEAKFHEEILGCPRCEEVYLTEKKVCMICGSPLMNAQECLEFVESYDWVMLPEQTNALLAAGYLRNNGIVVRISKKAPVSMMGMKQKVSLFAAREDSEAAENLLRELSARFTNCVECGHVLFVDEEECSFCTEAQGAV